MPRVRDAGGAATDRGVCSGSWGSSCSSWGLSTSSRSPTSNEAWTLTGCGGGLPCGPERCAAREGRRDASALALPSIERRIISSRMPPQKSTGMPWLEASLSLLCE